MKHIEHLCRLRQYRSHSSRVILSRVRRKHHRSLDPATRTEIYRRINRRVRELEPYSFLFFPAVEAALSRRIEGALPSPRGILRQFPGAAAFRVAAGGR